MFFDNISSYVNERLERVFLYFNCLPTMDSDYVEHWSSETARMTSIKESLRVLFYNFIFGVGLGNSDCHSTVVSFALNVGIVGILFWLVILKRFCRSFGFCFAVIFFTMFIEGGKGHIFDLSYCLILLCYSQLFFIVKTKKEIIYAF